LESFFDWDSTGIASAIMMNSDSDKLFIRETSLLIKTKMLRVRN
jgi:hypothetical protein